MAHSGVEAKPAWRSLPLAVRQRVQQTFGTPVTRATRTWGGYGPTPTFRLTLADGSRVFFKGTNRTSNDVARAALIREERVYRDLTDLIAPWAPMLYGSFHHDDWHVLLLEDVGPKSVPPWTPAKARQTAFALAAFHQATLGKKLPQWLPSPNEFLPPVAWSRVAEDSANLRNVAALAGEARHEAHSWLQAAFPLLSRLTEGVVELPGPFVLMHGDLRSDNLRLAQGSLRLFDWPAVSIGHAEWDIVPFAQSVTVEGGVEPEEVLAWYGQRFPIHAEALDASIAWWAAYFADRAWRPAIPGLPRLRQFQCQQLAVLLAWAARRFCLPEPGWVTAISR